MLLDDFPAPQRGDRKGLLENHVTAFWGEGSLSTLWEWSSFGRFSEMQQCLKRYGERGCGVDFLPEHSTLFGCMDARGWVKLPAEQ